MIQSDLKKLLGEVEEDLEDLMFGSVELFVQDGEITQVTIRRIKKTGSSATHSKANYQKEEESTERKYPKA